MAKRKRRESFGAVRKLPSGRVQASYVGPDGLRHNAPQTFDTLTDARGWLAAQQVRVLSGEWSTEETRAADGRPDLASRLARSLEAPVPDQLQREQSAGLLRAC